MTTNTWQSTWALGLILATSLAGLRPAAADCGPFGMFASAGEGTATVKVDEKTGKQTMTVCQNGKWVTSDNGQAQEKMPSPAASSTTSKTVEKKWWQFWK